MEQDRKTETETQTKTEMAPELHDAQIHRARFLEQLPSMRYVERHGHGVQRGQPIGQRREQVQLLLTEGQTPSRKKTVRRRLEWQNWKMVDCPTCRLEQLAEFMEKYVPSEGHSQHHWGNSAMAKFFRRLLPRGTQTLPRADRQKRKDLGAIPTHEHICRTSACAAGWGVNLFWRQIDFDGMGPGPDLNDRDAFETYVSYVSTELFGEGTARGPAGEWLFGSQAFSTRDKAMEIRYAVGVRRDREKRCPHKHWSEADCSSGMTLFGDPIED